MTSDEIIQLAREAGVGRTMKVEPVCPVVRLDRFRVKDQDRIVKELEKEIKEPQSWEDQVWNAAIQAAIRIVNAHG